MNAPTYRKMGDHTETVQVDYDPQRITYAQLLDIFWKSHEPTRRSWSRQYMHVVFYHNEEQKEIAEKSKQELEKSGRYERPVVTEIVPAPLFYKAEEYHQKYFKKHGLS